MVDRRVSMPASTAGLTRYFEEYKSKIEFKPGQVIIMAIAVVLVTLMLHLFGRSLIG